MEIVFVIDKDHAVLRLVKTGRHIGNEVEIVSGIQAGEKVVTDHAAQLVDGQRVETQSNE